MDILKPQLLWIDKRCYRVNSFTNTNAQAEPVTNEYIEEGFRFYFSLLFDSVAEIS